MTKKLIHLQCVFIVFFLLTLSGYIQAQPGSVIYRINAGGGAISNSIGNFIADDYFSSSSFTSSTSSPISGTDNDALYQTERWGTGVLSYQLPIANGQYKVILHFAELLDLPVDTRVFDVSIEGVKVLDNYDIVNKVGTLTATTETFTSTVTDGELNILLSSLSSDGGKENPKISAIEVITLSNTTPPVVSNEIPDQLSKVGSAFSYTFPVNSFTDPDNDVLTYSAGLANGVGLPSWLMFNPSTRTFIGTPINDNPSKLEVRVIATDVKGATVSDIFTLFITTPNSNGVAVYRINAGGGAITNTLGSFAADQYYSAASHNYTSSEAIAGTDNDALYQTERYGEGTLTYSLPVSNGQYEVVLHFAEIYHNSAGSRVFDIALEGQTVLDNFDIFAKVGAFTATTEKFTANVTDGVLTIHLSSLPASGGADNPKLNAIEVYSLISAGNTVVANPIADQSAKVGTLFSLTFPITTFSDPDNDVLTYTASLVNGAGLPSWLSFNSATRTFSGTPLTATPSSYTVRLRASDGHGGSVDEYFVLAVSPAIVQGNAIYRINAGGGALTNSIGSFSEDQYFNTSSHAYSSNDPISGTNDDLLYQTERWGEGVLSYDLPIDNGKYNVILHFAEIFYTNTNERIFDINIEGETVSDNYDIVAKAGAKVATTENYEVEVTDGLLNISLSGLSSDGGVANPKISGIEVLLPLLTPLQQDSLALVDLYTSTGGNNWRRKHNWLTGKVNDWYGIILENNRVTHIVLPSNNLRGELPNSFNNLDGLKSLRLSSDLITKLPEDLTNLQELEHLEITACQIKSLPQSIGSLLKLKTINFSWNQIEELPESIGNLINLETLFLPLNRLTHLPESIGNLTNLRVLTISENPIENFPNSITQLRKLEELFLESTLIKSLPNTIHLNPLTHLGFDGIFISAVPNELKDLPLLYLEINHMDKSLLPDFSIGYSYLRYLILNHCNLKTIPLNVTKDLVSLSLDYNEIYEIPESFKAFSSLKNFSIYNNKLDFGDLEDPNLPSSISYFYYNSQKSFPLYFNSDTKTFIHKTGGKNNIYRWFRDGFEILGENKASLGISDQEFNENSYYFCYITNTVIPDLLIFSDSKRPQDQFPQIPLISLGEDIIVTLPENSLNLDSYTSGLSDVISYSWKKVSGAELNLVNTEGSTLSLINLPLGTYTFRLTVTDGEGITIFDEIKVTVIEQPGNPSEFTYKENYNGNISAIKWSTKPGLADAEEKIYKYKYDDLNRLTNANFGVKSLGIYSFNGNYNEEGITYDLNGNIKTLKRFESAKVPNRVMDNLSYTYEGNQLKNVKDPVADFTGYDNGQKFNDTESEQYSYDKNGNLIEDKIKDLTISYNHLNLPERVDFGGNNYILYIYDAAGAKLAKEVHKSGETPTITYYNGNIVFENNNLQYITHSEGRAVPSTQVGQTGVFEYEYFLKDHLGNTRVTISDTEHQEEFTFLATMEEELEGTVENPGEKQFFTNIDKTRAQDPVFNHTTQQREQVTEDESARLNAANPVGPAISLKVSPGDKIDIQVFAKYLDNGGDYKQAITSIASSLAGAFTTTLKEGAKQVVGNAIGGLPQVGFDESSDIPKGYVNIIFLDKNYVYDPDFSEAKKISEIANGQFEELLLNKEIEKEGYVYIYVANETLTNVDVFFDDLKVTHIESPVKAHTDYYPFGYTIAGLSGESSGTNPNKYLYNGKELQDDVFEGVKLGWIDYGFRMYDPLLGKWHVIDMLASKHKTISPYAYVLNNPVLFIDPLGLDTIKGGTVHLPEVTVTSNRTGSDQWQNFISNMGQDGFDDFKQMVYQSKLDGYRTNLAANLYGLDSNGEIAIPDEILEREWEETEDEALPILQMMWASEMSGEDPSSLLFNINPMGQALFYNYLAQTGISNETAQSIVANVGIRVGLSWLGNGNTTGMNVKWLKESGGKINGISISKGGYGAKGRFDVHPLKHPSKRSNSMSIPKIFKRKNGNSIPLPHYHRGKGNNLHRHRPWEKGWLDKSIFDRF